MVRPGIGRAWPTWAPPSPGAPPRTTLTRNPHRPLVTGHENLVLRFGSAQKIRVHGGCPLPPPPPLADQSPKASASPCSRSGGHDARAGLGGAGRHVSVSLIPPSPGSGGARGQVAVGSESDEP